ncbi:MAG: hypothetical protein LBU89_06110 [Fibromonadaceae bacterium]|jgi:hypothetical protein|nr:hypothetical protein [Fibromonadaceae bacterium]
MLKFSIFVEHVKKLNFKFLLGLGAFCILAAIVNNIRAPEEKSVEWIGGQEILKGPE